LNSPSFPLRKKRLP